MNAVIALFLKPSTPRFLITDVLSTLYLLDLLDLLDHLDILDLLDLLGHLDLLTLLEKLVKIFNPHDHNSNSARTPTVYDNAEKRKARYSGSYFR